MRSITDRSSFVKVLADEFTHKEVMSAEGKREAQEDYLGLKRREIPSRKRPFLATSGFDPRWPGQPTQSKGSMTG